MKFLVISLLFFTSICESKVLVNYDENVDLKKLAGSYFADKDTIKEQLLKDVSGLYDKAKAEVDSLNKTAKIQDLKAAVELVELIDAGIKSTVPTTDVGNLYMALHGRLFGQGGSFLQIALNKAQAEFYVEDKDKVSLIEGIEHMLNTTMDVYQKTYDYEIKMKQSHTIIERLTQMVHFINNTNTALKTLSPTSTLEKIIDESYKTFINHYKDFIGIQQKVLQHQP